MKGSTLRGHSKNVWISSRRLLELDRGFLALLSRLRDTEVGGCLLSSCFRVLSVLHYQVYLFYLGFKLLSRPWEWRSLANIILELYKTRDAQSPVTIHVQRVTLPRRPYLLSGCCGSEGRVRWCGRLSQYPPPWYISETQNCPCLSPVIVAGGLDETGIV